MTFSSLSLVTQWCSTLIQAAEILELQQRHLAKLTAHLVISPTPKNHHPELDSRSKNQVGKNLQKACEKQHVVMLVVGFVTDFFGL